MMNAAGRIADHIVNNYSADYCNALVDIIMQASIDVPLTAVDKYNNTIIYMGAVCVIHDLNSGAKRLVYCHSTESFYFGFRSHNKKPELILSRLDSDRVGQVFARASSKSNKPRTVTIKTYIKGNDIKKEPPNFRKSLYIFILKIHQLLI